MNLRRKFKLEICYCIVFDVFKEQIIFTVCLKQLARQMVKKLCKNFYGENSPIIHRYLDYEVEEE